MVWSHYRIGLWSARIMVFLAVAYIATGAVGLRWVPVPAPPPGLVQVDPFLAILETIMVILAPVEVVLFAAIYAYATYEESPLPDARGSEGSRARTCGRATCALGALVFVGILAGLTCSVHFVLLTLGRQTGYAAVPGAFYPWPTALFAIDLLAWDIFQGLGLLFAAPVFRGGGLPKAIRVSMVISGALCLVGVAGPASGDLRFQVPAIFGYAGGLTVACALLAVFFGRLAKGECELHSLRFACFRGN